VQEELRKLFWLLFLLCVNLASLRIELKDMVYSSYEVSGKIDKIGDVKFEVGDSCKCPQGHKAKIVWISEDKETIAVRCPSRHFRKMAKVADHSVPPLSYGRYRTKEKEIFAKNMVFMVARGRFG
jgi:hypothetical protein